MKYPKLKVLESSRQMVDTFRGYNHNLRISDGEFYNMKNMTSDCYPILSPRGERGTFAKPANPQGMIAKDSLCYVDGSEFVMDEYRIDMGLSTAAEDCPKRLVSMGAYVIILPDKKYINTADIADFGNIEAEVQTTAPVSFTLCRLDGSEYLTEYIQSDEPVDPANMTLWIDTSTTPHTLKQWAESSGMWVQIATTYVKITSAGIGIPFEKYDGITISGLKGAALHDNASGELIANTDEIAAFDGSAVVWDKGDNYIVITGLLDVSTTISDSITIARKMPNMDFVVESNNRLWGCRYGVAVNGEVVNEIYASKLGDFKNWNCFMGISTDSWVGSVGSDGQFTGAITHLGYPLFFKENVLHKVYISGSGGHGIQDTACRGVQKGCDRSLAIVNEVLYYKARHAVCAYDGSLPVEISSAMGDEYYGNAVAGAHGNKYYISMQNTTGQDYNLFVYDTAKGIWHREDETQVDAFCSCRDEMYFIDHADGSIKTVHGTGEKSADPVEWMVQTGPLGTGMPDMKYISRLTVRLSLEEEATADFYIQYDSIGQWDKLCTVEGTHLRSYAVPIRPRRCDHFRLRIQGQGDAKIYSMTKTIEQGSDYS